MFLWLILFSIDMFGQKADIVDPKSDYSDFAGGFGILNGISDKNINAVKSIMLYEKTNDYILYGKTGGGNNHNYEESKKLKNIKAMEITKTHENYTAWIVILSNLVSILIYTSGFIITLRLGWINRIDNFWKWIYSR